jgi:hypothetical protein
VGPRQPIWLLFVSIRLRTDILATVFLMCIARWGGTAVATHSFARCLRYIYLVRLYFGRAVNRFDTVFAVPGFCTMAEV